MEFPGIGKLNKEITVDPSRAFGAQGQSQKEILGRTYTTNAVPSAVSKAGSLFSGLKEKAAGLASQVHILTPNAFRNPAPPEAPYPQEAYPQDPTSYPPEGYVPQGYDYPPQEPMEESGAPRDGWYNPFTDPPSQDPYRQPVGAACGYAPYGGYAPYSSYAPPSAPDYGYGQTPDYGYSEPPASPYGYAEPEESRNDQVPQEAGSTPRDSFGEAYAPEEYPPYGGPELPYGYDPYNPANGYYVGDDPYGNPMYVPFKPTNVSSPAPSPRKSTDIKELKSTLWAVSIALGAVLTLFSFVYSCIV